MDAFQCVEHIRLGTSEYEKLTDIELFKCTANTTTTDIVVM